MTDHGPIPSLPYLYGALAATALVARGSGAGGARAGEERDPGFVRLAVYTLVVAAATWIWVSDWFDRVLGLLLFLGADWVLKDRDGRAAAGRVWTKPVTRWQILLALAPISFFAIVLLASGWIPRSGPPPAVPPDGPTVSDSIGAALVGAMVVFFTSRLPGLWWRHFAAWRRDA